MHTYMHVHTHTHTHTRTHTQHTHTHTHVHTHNTHTYTHKFSLTLGFGLIVSLRFLMVGSHDARKFSVATQLFCIMYKMPSVVMVTGRSTYIRLLVVTMIFIT